VRLHLNLDDRRLDAELVAMGDHIDAVVARPARRIRVVAHGAKQRGDERLERISLEIGLDAF